MHSLTAVTVADFWQFFLAVLVDEVAVVVEGDCRLSAVAGFAPQSRGHLVSFLLSELVLAGLGDPVVVLLDFLRTIEQSPAGSLVAPDAAALVHFQLHATMVRKSEHLLFD